MNPIEVAEAVRSACIEAAAAAYEDAGLQGICAEGRWEAAVGAMRSIDLARLIPPNQRGENAAVPDFTAP